MSTLRAGVLWRAARAPLAVAAVLLVGALTLALTARQPVTGALDPESVGEPGTRALVILLRDAGVAVTTTRASADVAAAGRDTTVLVAFPDRLSHAQRDAVARSAADLVLVAPDDDRLRVLAPLVRVSGFGLSAAALEPGCALPAARAAGVAELGGYRYRSPLGVGCYLDDTGAALIRMDDGNHVVTVLGGPEPMVNAHLADEGNATLAMRLLGERPRLLWYLPGPESVADRRSLAELVPDGWRWAPVQLAVAVAVTAAWRARRLGALVSEPLPVVVRAAETTEGRARLYRRARARGHAAGVLRAAARDRLAATLGLGRPDPVLIDPVLIDPVLIDPVLIDPVLIDEVAARTGRPVPAVRELLYGPGPGDDQAMVELADQLDDCEREVRRS